MPGKMTYLIDNDMIGEMRYLISDKMPGEMICPIGDKMLKDDIFIAMICLIVNEMHNE